MSWLNQLKKWNKQTCITTVINKFFTANLFSKCLWLLDSQFQTENASTLISNYDEWKCRYIMAKHTSGLHTNSVWYTISTWLGIEVMLEVEVICPVEQVDHDKRQGEGDSGVVVYVVRVLHVATIYGADHFAKHGQGSEAPVGGLRLWRRCLRLGLAARGAGRADC